MKKKISTSALRVGMHIHDLATSWINHPFVTSSFLVKDEGTIQRIASAGIREVVIDTALGLDVADETPAPETKPDEPKTEVKRKGPATLEIERARHL